MINLYQWPSLGQWPNGGSFCIKLESYLRFMQIEHKVISTTSMKNSPKKTMPFIEKDGQFMSDSRLIIEHIESTHQKKIDQHLSLDQKAQSNAYIGMLEKNLIPVMIYFRWQNEIGWSQFSRAIFKGAPSLIRVLIGGVMRKTTLKSLYSNGIGRHSEPEVISFAKQDIESISNLLGSKNFVFGDKVSLLDLVTFSILGSILYGQVDMPLINLVKQHKNLVDHIGRMMKLIYQKEMT